MAKCDTRCASISKKRLGEQVSGAVDLHPLACLVSYIPPEGVDTDGAVRAIYPVPTPVYNKYCWPTQETPGYTMCHTGKSGPQLILRTTMKDCTQLEMTLLVGVEILQAVLK